MTVRRLLVFVALLGLGAGVYVGYLFLDAAIPNPEVPYPEVLGVRPASVSIPAERPFVGADGVDKFGYPLRTADRVALLHLLRLGMYAELDQFLGEFQADFETDNKKEYWPLDAFDTFGVVDPTVGIELDNWVEQYPSSWAARMARGRYRTALGWFARGEGTSLETGISRFRAMRKAFAEARLDFDAAVEAKPTLVAAHRQLIIMGTTDGDYDGRRAALKAALAVCPSCFQVRVAYVLGLRPIWGGAYDEMTSFAEAAQQGKASNEHLGALEGYVTLEHCRLASRNKQQQEARQLCEKLVEYEHWEFDLQLGQVLIRMDQPREALRYFDRALTKRPQEPETLRYRAYALSHLERWEELIATVLTLRQMDVTDDRVANLADDTVNRTLVAVRTLATDRDFSRTNDLLNQLLLLRPGDEQIRIRQANLPAFQAAMTPKSALSADADQQSELERLEVAAATAPDSFEARQALDTALFRLNRFDDIVTVWDEYIRRHPNDGRAYLERGGTHTHRRDATSALSDLDAACNLRVEQGCQMAALLRQKLGR